MTSYLVTWSIDIEDVDSPEEAAARALIVMRDNDPANTATVFEVTTHGTDQTLTVDLSDDICRTCGDYYTGYDGYDGECPSCADAPA